MVQRPRRPSEEAATRWRSSPSPSTRFVSATRKRSDSWTNFSLDSAPTNDNIDFTPLGVAWPQVWMPPPTSEGAPSVTNVHSPKMSSGKQCKGKSPVTNVGALKKAPSPASNPEADGMAERPERVRRATF